MAGRKISKVMSKVAKGKKLSKADREVLSEVKKGKKKKRRSRRRRG
jgi:hypothetical protein